MEEGDEVGGNWVSGPEVEMRREKAKGG